MHSTMRSNHIMHKFSVSMMVVDWYLYRRCVSYTHMSSIRSIMKNKN